METAGSTNGVNGESRSDSYEFSSFVTTIDFMNKKKKKKKERKKERKETKKKTDC
jgi:rRNA processing protein Gar1